MNMMARPDAGALASGDAVNLTDLADHYGSDKGSTKHRYTELYHMLFLPYRQRKITFLEMGLLIGGPEHGISKDRETRDLPSIRMWLDYFPKAQIIGMDVSDFAWFEHERFSFRRCDMDSDRGTAAPRAQSYPPATSSSTTPAMPRTTSRTPFWSCSRSWPAAGYTSSRTFAGSRRPTKSRASPRRPGYSEATLRPANSHIPIRRSRPGSTRCGPRYRDASCSRRDIARTAATRWR